MKYTILVKTNLSGRTYVPYNTVAKIVVVGNGNRYTTDVPIDTKLSSREATWIVFGKAVEFLDEVGVQPGDEVVFTSDNAVFLRNFTTKVKIPEFNKLEVQKVLDLASSIGCNLLFDIKFRDHKHLMEETPLDKKLEVRENVKVENANNDNIFGYTHTGTTASGVFFRYITEEPVEGMNQRKIEYKIVKQW